MNPHAHRLQLHPPRVVLALLGTTLILAPAAGAAAAPTHPVVKTGATSGVTYQSANLRGTVNPGGAPTTYFFQYGPTSAYGSQSQPAGVASASTAVGVSSPIGGLVAALKYHYRLVAINAAGTAIGADATFTTKSIPLSLAIGALPSPVIFGAPVSVVGTLSGTGAANRTVVLQANPFPFTAGFQNLGNPELTSATGSFQFNLVSLPATTQFRVVSVGAGPPVISATLTEYVELGVSMHVRSRHTRRGYYSVRFSGTVSPAEVGARVSVQRLIGGRWRLVAATNALPSAPGFSKYARTLRLHHGGFYRVYALPVEGGHVANSSQPLLVHLGGGF